MDTGKNGQIFRQVQQQVWKIPQEYAQGNSRQYDRIIERISQEWNYQNDDWHYETSTLRISVEPLENSYTRYWICHVETFSTEQLCSALCRGNLWQPTQAHFPGARRPQWSAGNQRQRILLQFWDSRSG